MVRRPNWTNDVRLHLALASVGNSTLMMQSGVGRVQRATGFLAESLSLSALSGLDEARFLKFLDQKTGELASLLPRPDTQAPNWGAARKVLNIYLRLCAMNKDLNPAFGLSVVEPLLEVPLDGQVVSKIDECTGSKFARDFTIKDLAEDMSADIQAAAKVFAAAKGLHRYELDVVFWNVK